MRLALALLIAAGGPSAADNPLRTIAFGSCLKQTRPVPALQAIADLKPDLFIWLGDNIYADTEDMAKMRAMYGMVRALPAYARLVESTAVIGVWDDHDYGKNDAGREFPAKVGAQKELLDFLGEPTRSPRRRQEGIYACRDFGPEGKQVRVILLDTRYFRDPVGSNGTILGEAQWAWLEKTLKESPAEVNVLVSSIQVLSSEHPFEKWANFPNERKRMLELLERKEVPPVVILSGDRHVGEISLDGRSCGYGLYDVTSSSLNMPLGAKEGEKNPLRVGSNFWPANFGTLTLDWSREVPVVTAAVRDAKGSPQRAVSFQLVR